jgi:hypothetical protein
MQEKENPEIDTKTSDQIVEIGTIKSRHSKPLEFRILSDQELADLVGNTDSLGRLILDAGGRGLSKGKVAKYFGKSASYIARRYWSDKQFREGFYTLSNQFAISGNHSRINIQSMALSDSVKVYSRILELSQSDETPPHVALSASNSILDLANPKDNQGIAISIGSLLVELANRSDIVAVKPDN